MNKNGPGINLNLSSSQMNQKNFSSTITRLTKMGNRRDIDGVSSHRILIVEDETKLLGHLDRVVRTEGYSTFTCSSFSELETLLKIPVKRFDIIILDRLLHGRDTAVLIGQMKKSLPEVKILVLSAINSSAEKAQVLDFGADDYVAKPFETDELIARIRAILRRSQRDLQFGNVVLDSARRVFKINDHEVPLQNKEFILLRTFLGSPGKVFNKIYLYEHVWEMNPEVESNVVEATVNKLRRRLEEFGASFSIKSMRNKGYWVEE